MKAYTNVAKAGRSVFVVGGTSVSQASGDYNDYRFQYWTGGQQNVGQGSGSNAGACVSVYAPSVGIFAARNGAWATLYNTYPYGVADGTSFAAPMAAAVGIRWAVKYAASHGGSKPSYSQVYDFILSNAITPVYNAQTPAYWYCASSGEGIAAYSFRSNPPSACPTETLGVPGTNAPVYFPSVGNSSNAKMLYWDEANGGQCP